MIYKSIQTFILGLALITRSFSQPIIQIQTNTEFSNNKIENTPFWAKMNRWGTTPSNSQNVFNQLNFSLKREISDSLILSLGAEISGVGGKNQWESSELYVDISNKWGNFMVGRKKRLLGENDSSLSLGSMVLSSNAIPIPRISVEIPEYHLLKIGNIPFKIKGGLSHGWLDKGLYTKEPLLHEKWLYLSYKNGKYSGHLGLVHEAIWGGATKLFGSQPTSIEDYLRVFFLRGGSDSAVSGEQFNALGNHLGMWDVGIRVKKVDYNYHFYLQHPYEDRSGAQWLLNYPDGLWGLSVHANNKKGWVTDILVELLYTMHQSGSGPASDSTYGWDDYYNNYVYVGGWVYQGKVIGNPMLTLGQNEIRDWTHVVNNRVIALHSGIEGNISTRYQYKFLLTYSMNFGTYVYKDQSNKKGIKNDYEGGLSQLSYRVDLNLNNLLSKKNITAILSLIGDSGELYNNSKMIMIGIEWYYSKATN
jgi:hypothetical protein